MVLIKLNRRDFIDFNNIKKVVKKDSILWVYKKSGYPHAIKTEFGIERFLLGCCNAGVSTEDIQKIKNEYEKTN